MRPLPPIFSPSGAGQREPQASTPEQLIDLKEVRRRTGLGRSTIYELIAAGTFPKGIKITPTGFATRWRASAVEAWIQDRIADAEAAR